MKRNRTNLTSRVITGGILIALGGVLVLVSFAELEFLIYALPLLAIGLFLFFNDKEDDIEQIKNNLYYYGKHYHNNGL